MPKTRHIYVDFSNLRIEGRHLAGELVGKKEAPWHCDFKGLLDVARGGQPLGRTLLVTSDPFPASQHAWDAGWEVITYPRSFHDKEKCVDTRLAVEAVRDGLSEIRDAYRDEFVLVSGDLDQQPVAALLKREGYSVHNLFWGPSMNALHTSCDTFESLNTHWDRVTWSGARKQHDVQISR